MNCAGKTAHMQTASLLKGVVFEESSILEQYEAHVYLYF